jgi:protein-S-isoprenylcysteine O-methyltransferase Ste14
VTVSGNSDALFRLIVAAELAAIVGVRAWYSFFNVGEAVRDRSRGGAEAAWFTTGLAVLALLHFGAVLAYIAWPPILAWSTIPVAEPIRWAVLAVSCAGVVGELWAAVSLGAGYSPRLRVAEKQALITIGTYRWIRHPLYAFGLPLMVGWGVAAGNWFIATTGLLIILLVMLIRVPREEAMMLGVFGESYRAYMSRTGRFVPRWRPVRGR